MSAQGSSTIIPSRANGILYLPLDSWVPVAANGATDGQGQFLLGDDANGLANSSIRYTFSQPATGFEYWGWQRSDGGLFSICFDCAGLDPRGDRFDALNASTNGSEDPRLLYSNYGLTYAIHNVTVVNTDDPWATIQNATDGGYGQMSLDRFVLVDPSSSATSSVASPTSAPKSSGSTSATSSASIGPVPAGGESSNRSNSVGAMAGGIAGGVVGLACIALLLWLLLSRKSWTHTVQDLNGEDDPNSHESMESDPAIVPFLLDAHSPEAGRGNRWPRKQAPQPAAAVPAVAAQRPPAIAEKSAEDQPRESSHRPVWSVPRPSDLPAVLPSPPELGAAALSSALVFPRREEDAGFLLGDELETMTLPPDYDAATASRRAAGLS